MPQGKYIAMMNGNRPYQTKYTLHHEKYSEVKIEYLKEIIMVTDEKPTLNIVLHYTTQYSTKLVSMVM